MTRGEGCNKSRRLKTRTERNSRCLAGGSGSHGGGGGVATGRAGVTGAGHSVLGRNTTDYSRLRPTARPDDRKSVSGHHIEVVEVVAVGGGRTATPLNEDGDNDLLVADPGSTSVVTNAANLTTVEETPM